MDRIVYDERQLIAAITDAATEPGSGSSFKIRLGGPFPLTQTVLIPQAATGLKIEGNTRTPLTANSAIGTAFQVEAIGVMFDGVFFDNSGETIDLFVDLRSVLFTAVDCRAEGCARFLEADASVFGGVSTGHLFTRCVHSAGASSLNSIEADDVFGARFTDCSFSGGAVLDLATGCTFTACTFTDDVTLGGGSSNVFQGCSFSADLDTSGSSGSNRIIGNRVVGTLTTHGTDATAGNL